jgi:Beta-lactamase enzyme family
VTRKHQSGRRALRRTSVSALLVAGLVVFGAQSPPSTAATASTAGVHKGVKAHQNDPLEVAAMRAYLSSRAGNITIALYDVKSGMTYLYRPGVEEQTASVVKVDILQALLHQYQESKAPLGQENDYLASLMIEDSDDDAATSLWNEVGGAAGISKYNDLVGLSATVPNTAGYWGETMTTALDQVELVKHIVFPNTVLDDASRAFELDLMRHVIPIDTWGVSTGPTPSTLVALKNGWVPIVDGNWQINTIGYVTGDGRSYVLAVLTNGNPSEYTGIQTVDGISSRIWSALSS